MYKLVRNVLVPAEQAAVPAEQAEAAEQVEVPAEQVEAAEQVEVPAEQVEVPAEQVDSSSFVASRQV